MTENCFFFNILEIPFFILELSSKALIDSFLASLYLVMGKSYFFIRSERLS
jgi:hypothetical protein